MTVRAGVVGVGRLGREHVRVLSGLDGVDHVSCYDVVGDRAREVAESHGAQPYENIEDLLGAVDAVCIVAPTTEHARLTEAAISADCDVFVEKPMSRTVAEGERMIDLARGRERILQVGHVERFNAAVQAVVESLECPEFIEVHRLSPFSVRGTDVSVVGDLMIHDLDLLGLLVGEWPSEIRAKGAAILTTGPDIVNARLEFPGGCVANVTASRVTATPMRKIRVFSPTEYVSIDLLQGRATRYRRSPGFDARMQELRGHDAGRERLNLTDFVDIEMIQPDATEPLAKELAAFVHSVQTRAEPPVTGDDGLRAVRLAVDILEHMGVSAA